MDLSTSEKIYTFDEPFFTIFRVMFLKRKSPESPFQLQHIKPMTLAAVGDFIFILNSLFSLLKHLQSSDMDLAGIGEIVAIASTYVIAFCRGTTLLVYRKEVKRLLQNLEKLFPTTKHEQLQHNLSSYAKTIISRNKIMRGLCSFGTLAFLTKPVLQSLFEWKVQGQPYTYLYPFVSWHPFDDQRLLAYPFVYFFQTASSMVGVFFLFNEDMIFTMSVTYMCMYYSHLNQLLSQLDARNQSKSSEKLKDFIRYQYVLEDLRMDIDVIFSFSTFVSFTILKISLCMFMFSLFHGVDVLNMLPYTLAMLALLVPVYLRCSNGTALYEASANMVNSMYDHNWHEGTIKHRKMIAIMMARANRPVLLQASKINYIYMEYFKEFMLQTYQIFMFLHSFSE